MNASFLDASCLVNIPDTVAIRRQLARRAAETKVLRKLLRAAESKKLLLGGTELTTGHTMAVSAEVRNAG